MEHSNSDIKKRFVQFCKDNKITQSEIAFFAQMSQQGVGKYFDTKTDTMPGLNVVYWLRANRGLDIDWLMTGNETKVGDNQNISFSIGNAGQNNEIKQENNTVKDCVGCPLVATNQGLMDTIKELAKKK